HVDTPYLLTYVLFFICHNPPTPHIYTLSLHDALPISQSGKVAKQESDGSQDPAFAEARRLSQQGKFDEAIAKLEALATNDPILRDRKSTRLNSSHLGISYAVFCLKKKRHTT